MTNKNTRSTIMYAREYSIRQRYTKYKPEWLTVYRRLIRGFFLDEALQININHYKWIIKWDTRDCRICNIIKHKDNFRSYNDRLISVCNDCISSVYERNKIICDELEKDCVPIWCNIDYIDTSKYDDIFYSNPIILRNIYIMIWKSKKKDIEATMNRWKLNQMKYDYLVHTLWYDKTELWRYFWIWEDKYFMWREKEINN